MARTICNITKAAFWGTLLAAAASCTYDDSLCVEDRPGYKEGNDVWLSVDVRSLDPSAGNGSRADNSNHPEEDGTAPENYINVDDVKVLFVGPEGTVMRVLDRDNYVVVKPTDETNYTNYTLTFNINREYFSIPSGQDKATFKLMVVANASGAMGDGGSEFTTTKMWAKTPEGVARDLTSFKYSPKENVVWEPSIANKRGIPMTGLVAKEYSQNDIIGATSQSNALEAGIIYMQRAMAKFRFIDQIVEHDESMRGVSIQSVRFIGYANQGAYFPYGTTADSEWYTNGARPLEQGTMKKEWYQENAILSTSPVRFHDSETNKEYSAFTCYVPEFNINSFDELVVTPRIEVKVHGLNDPSKTDDITTYNYWLSRVGEPGIWQIARNHIYEIRINVEPNLKLNLTVNVKDWDKKEFDYELSEVVTVDEENRLKWTIAASDDKTFSTGVKSYNGKDENQLTINAGPEKSVVGTFKISSPTGSTWTAYLTPGENGSGAFEFVDAEGNVITAPSGSVPEKDNANSVIRIRATHKPDALDHYAELAIAVRTADGRVQYAPIGYNGSNRYIIYQQKTL